MSQDQDKKQSNEYKKHPVINLSDSINRSMVGDLKSLTNGGCLTNIITLVVVIVIIGGGLLILSQCSR
ncbi:hypothetical protein ABWW58_14740 [Sporolactobacillus sp. STCC-11]|uniref:hypothetical protein n=1 Tax=Sporolactobacillus caesalpiniae TaxID=3230362 RepID=UPI003394462E